MQNNQLFKSKPIGSWLQIGNPEFTRMMIQSGFDFLIIDMEHGSISERCLPALFEVFKDSNCVSIVRIAKNDPLVKEYLKD